MRILIYNWVDYHDPQGRGGGVSTYARRLMERFAEQPGVEALFLSSGLAHDMRARAPRWRPARPVGGAVSDRRFEIVNSACLAPSHHSFGAPAQLTEPATESAFSDFLRRKGPFDIVHFHNLEGVPAGVLGLRPEFPDTRFVLSLHNYYPFCPQVNLWHRETAHCTDFAGGARCIDCLPFRPDPRVVRLANAFHGKMHSGGLGPGTGFYDRGARPVIRATADSFRRLASLKRGGAPSRAAATSDDAPHDGLQAAAFAARRARMVEFLNLHCDRVLCVSRRVREIAAGFGIAPARLATCYIGTDHAHRFAQTRPRADLPRPDGTARLAYLGYMRRDKGFHFLLDALETLPPTQAARLHLTVAAAGRDGDALSRLRALGPRFASLDWHDGYRPDALDGLLEDVDVGIVPGLWEDNLPQVALEMHARHIPLLTSDRGGARELADYPAMVFPAGDVAALHARLDTILAGGIDLEAYWAGAMAPIGMEQHIAELLGHYAELAAMPDAPAAAGGTAG